MTLSVFLIGREGPSRYHFGRAWRAWPRPAAAGEVDDPGVLIQAQGAGSGQASAEIREQSEDGGQPEGPH